MADPNVLNVAGDIGRGAAQYWTAQESVRYRYGYAQPLMAPGGTDAARALVGAAERLEAAAQVQRSAFQLGGVIAGGLAFALSGSPWAGVATYSAISAYGQYASIKEKERKLESPSEFYREVEKSRFKEAMDRAQMGPGPEYMRNLARMGRTFGGLSASGGIDFGAAIMPGRLAAQLGITPDELHSVMSGAMSVGGVRGAAGVKENVLIQASKAGIYGSPAEVASSIAQGIRFGFTDRSVLDAARQLGTTAGEAAGLQVGLKTSVGLTGQAGLMEKIISGGLMSTNIAAMSPQIALGMMNSVYQGAGQAGQGNEAILMLQYARYRAVNPGASYMEFKRDQLSGFKTEKGRRMIGDITSMGERGDFASQIIASSELGGAYSPIQFDIKNIKELNRSVFRGGIPIQYRSSEGAGAGKILGRDIEVMSREYTEIEQRGIFRSIIDASSGLKDFGKMMAETGDLYIIKFRDPLVETTRTLWEFNTALTEITKKQQEEVDKKYFEVYKETESIPLLKRKTGSQSINDMHFWPKSWR